MTAALSVSLIIVAVIVALVVVVVVILVLVVTIIVTSILVIRVAGIGVIVSANAMLEYVRAVANDVTKTHDSS